MTTFTRGENPLRADKLNTAFDERVLRAGDMMVGPLTLVRDPVAPLEAATKQYVDRFTSVGVPTGAYIGGSPPGNTIAPLWWDTGSGQLYIQYNDGTSTQWVVANSLGAGGTGGPFLPLGGGTINGQLNVSPSAAAPNHVITSPIAPGSITGAGQQFQSYLAVAATGGTPGQVYTNAAFNSSITVAPTTNVWGVLSTIDYSGTGGHAQHVNFYGQNQRHTKNATGQNPELFGAVFEQIDWTNTDTATGGGMNGIEIDMTCGNTDSAGIRRGFGMYLNRANAGDIAPVVGTGMHLAANVGSYDVVFKIQTAFNIAAVDLRLAGAVTGAAHQIWLGTAGTIALDTNASIMLSGDAGGAMIMTGMAGSPARIIFEPAGGTTRQWWAGAWNDNNFYIGDSTAAVTRLTITPAGLFTFNGPIEVNGVSVYSFASNPAFSMLFATLPTNAVNDAAAAGAGVPVGGVYRNGSVLMVRTV